ncbi:MAG: ankyrin repeat domain-containing protein [Rickettsiaceae bacterium]|nr:ankyrin repeat domain-containing protein [Rickettsiaceae bacterium]
MLKYNEVWLPCLSVFSRMFRRDSVVSEMEEAGTMNSSVTRSPSVNYISKYGAFTVVPEVTVKYQDFVDDAKDSSSNKKGSVNPIVKAAEIGILPYLEDIIPSDSEDINAVDVLGKTAIIRAAEKNLFECVQLLIKLGADVNAVAYDGTTALINAVANNNVLMVNMLLNSGAKTDVLEGDNTILDLSILYTSDISVARLLISRGFDISDGHSLELAKEICDRKEHIDLLTNKMAITGHIYNNTQRKAFLRMESIKEDEKKSDVSDDIPTLQDTTNENHDNPTTTEGDVHSESDY